MTRPDCILVLCNFLNKRGEIVEEFRVRLLEAASQSEMSGLTIIVNGGQTHDTPCSQGRAAYEFLLSLGIPGERILWGEGGHDTLDELRIAMTVMNQHGWRHPMVVANWLHLKQVAVAFWRLGVPYTPAATPLKLMSLKYLAMRLLILPLTVIDPLGKSWVFRLTRQSRESWLGQKF